MPKKWHKYYRDAKGRLASCLREFSANADKLALVINLGDLFDGYNNDDVSSRPYFRAEMPLEMQERNRRELEEMIETLSKTRGDFDIVHVVGNHDLCVGRETFREKMKIPTECYYAMDLPRS